MFETRFTDLAQVEVRKIFICGKNPTFLELGFSKKIENFPRK
jgi:hypothetical protein